MPETDVGVYSANVMGNSYNSQRDHSDYMLAENFATCVVGHCDSLTRKAVNSRLLEILKIR